MRPAVGFARSVGYALRGWAHAWRTQAHLRCEGLVGIVAIAAAVVLGTGVAAVVLACTVVLVAELFNTAVEATVDLVAPAPDPRAAIAKDVAAGAVLVAALGAVGVGLAVFGPPAWRWLAAAVG